MPPTATIPLTETLKIIAAATTAATIILTTVWWIAWPHVRGRVYRALEDPETWPLFRRLVLKGLEEEGPAFQAWNARFWEPRIQSWDEGVAMAEDTTREISAIAKELRELRADFAQHRDLLIVLPKTLIDLDATLKGLTETIKSVGDRQVQADIAIARMQGGAMRARRQSG